MRILRNQAAPLLQYIRWLLQQLRAGLDRLVTILARAWRWADSLNIPLSPLQWILLFYFIVGAAYLVATPVFEANDEIWHFGMIRHLRTTKSLPIQVFDGQDTIYQQHGSQPPLYYALMALVTAPFGIEDVGEYGRLNPHVHTQQPDSYGNKNLIIHDASLTLLRGTGLVVFIARVLGLALGGGTVYFVYRIGEMVAPQRQTVAFVAAAITALNPMFIFVSASVNNDSLAMALNGALIFLMMRTLRDGFSPRYSLAMALLFALTSLTKLTALILLPVLLAVALVVYRKTRDPHGLALFVYMLAFFWLLISGWWYLRNIQLYGEPFGIITMANITGPRGMIFDSVGLLAEFQQFRMSYWGLFGARNIQVAGIFYILLDLMSFLSVVGCVFLVLQLLAIRDFAYARYELTHLATLISALVLLWLGVIYWSTLARAPEGRILFPLIAVVSPLMAVGFVEIVWWTVFSLRPPNLEFVRAGDAVPKELLHDTMLWQLRFLGLVALFAPFTVIASQYNAPQPLTEVPENAPPVYAEFGDVALVAYERVDRRYGTGDKVRLKFYWQVLRQSAEDNSILLTLVDDRQQAIGRYVTYPGAGSLRTSGWQVGAIYPDEYLISIDSGASGRYPFDVQVEWENLHRAQKFAATDAAGARIEPVLLNVGAVVTLRNQTTAGSFNEIDAEAQPNFDQVIRLEGFRLHLDINEIVLHWTAESVPEENYTVFVHMLGENGEILAQADAPPRLPTKYWRWGETYSTFHRIPSADSMLDYEVVVGLYVSDGLSFPRAEYQQILIDEETQEEIETMFDAYAIAWESASEVQALTPTPEPISEDETEGPTESLTTTAPARADAAE